MNILKNALDSIAIGLEDFTSSDERRAISSTRNIFAGILLLFKHKLCQLSPDGTDEVLIKQTALPSISPEGQITWIGKGKKTVDVQNIKDRFNSLNIDVDWPRIEKINKYRNDIEHYYSTLNAKSVQSLISDSFVIIRDFIRDHLGLDPKELLGEAYWKILIEVNEVYEKEKSDCNSKLQTLNYFSNEILCAFEQESCSECGSGLIEPTSLHVDATESDFHCRSCGHTESYEQFCEHAVTEYYQADVYLSYTDGGDSPLTDCPECGSGLYIYHEGVCAICGHEASHTCLRCQCSIPPEEINDSGFCGYCLHIIQKDD